MKFKIFVDGQHGTTGLKIHEMLENRDDVELLTIKEEEKKDINKRKELLNSADLVFLCLPDDASRESVSLIKNSKTKVIDASTAHRTNKNWTYGIPELTSKQRDKIKNSTRVCVPGCHASGLILAMKPLRENKIIRKNHKLICHSITGFSGGGSSMINDYKNGNFELIGGQRPYALGLNHKHLPEMKYILKLNEAPIFTPSVGNFEQGMLVIRVIENNDEYLDNGFLNPMKCNNTNSLEISVYENKTDLVVISRLDNLGKGASGAAVQCMNIMLGLEEKKGLEMA